MAKRIQLWMGMHGDLLSLVNTGNCVRGWPTVAEAIAAVAISRTTI